MLIAVMLIKKMSVFTYVFIKVECARHMLSFIKKPSSVLFGVVLR